MENICVKATVENLSTVTEFIDGLLEKNDCPLKTQMQIDVAVDELFGNIANYAYGKNVGEVVIEAGYNTEKNEFSITFIDSGVAYNPLEKEDPDITLSAEERQIGGLGIFLVKKTMDNLIYDYKNNKNILTIIKKF